MEPEQKPKLNMRFSAFFRRFWLIPGVGNSTSSVEAVVSPFNGPVSPYGDAGLVGFQETTKHPNLERCYQQEIVESRSRATDCHHFRKKIRNDEADEA